MEDYKVIPFKIEHYIQALQLWKNSEGISLSRADSQEAIERFLLHNPGLSFVALQGEKLIGTILCGCDGRRGYIHHLAVHADYQKKGIGKKLAGESLSALKTAGIQRCHIFVVKNNLAGQEFWEHTGWFRREDILIMSYDIS